MPYVGKKPADIIATAVDTTTGTFSGDIDVDGTTNLDVVDIDGAVDMASSLSVTGNLLVGGTTTNHQSGSSQEQLSYIAGDYFAVSRSSNDVAFFNRQSTDGSIINVRKDGTTVGTIGSRAGVALNIVLDPRTDGCGLTGVGQVIRPTDESGTNEDNTIDLGSSSHRFKDLYLSGGAYLGGTGSANYLDDYEEGSWTPSGNWSASGGYYVKVGSVVHISLDLTANGTGGTSQIDNLPFTCNTTIGSGIYTSNVSFASGRTAPVVVAAGSTLYFRAVGSGVAFSSMPINANATTSISFTYRTTS